MTQKELKAELQAAIRHQENKIKDLTGNNPQVKELQIEAEHLQEAFQAVLNRINGQRIALKLYS